VGIEDPAVLEADLRTGSTTSVSHGFPQLDQLLTARPPSVFPKFVGSC